MVEGRDQRGVGMDLYQMAELAVAIGGVTALNLDGGRASNMAWRSETNSNIINTVNPYHLDAYPVGTIITFT